MQKQQLLHRAEDRHVFVSETDKTPAKEFDIFMHATLFQLSVCKHYNDIISYLSSEDKMKIICILCSYLMYCLKKP